MLKNNHKSTQRLELKALGFNHTLTFEATFKCVGYKTRKYYRKSLRTIYEPTLCFTNVKCNGKVVADHIWMNYSKRFINIGRLFPGDVVRFNGRIGSYVKGYYDNTSIDYTIKLPSKVQLIKKTDLKSGREMPIDKNALVGYVMKRNKDYYLDSGRTYDDWYVRIYQQWYHDYRYALRHQLQF